MHDNLRNLGLDVLDVVNMRSMLGVHGPAEGSLEAPLTALAELRQRHARRLTGRRTLVLVISDGLDTGEPAQLAQELQWLKRHSRRLLWLNPLLRFEGYAPLARGAGVLHRHADAMLAVHNLSALEQLAASLAALMRSGR